MVRMVGMLRYGRQPFGIDELESTIREEMAVSKRMLVVDLGVRASHVTTLCSDRGEVLWSKRQFRNRHDELVDLAARIGECDALVVVMEPTRNAWVPVVTAAMRFSP